MTSERLSTPDLIRQARSHYDMLNDAGQRRMGGQLLKQLIDRLREYAPLEASISSPRSGFQSGDRVSISTHSNLGWNPNYEAVAARLRDGLGTVLGVYPASFGDEPTAVASVRHDSDGSVGIYYFRELAPV